MSNVQVLLIIQLPKNNIGRNSQISNIDMICT